MSGRGRAIRRAVASKRAEGAEGKLPPLAGGLDARAERLVDTVAELYPNPDEALQPVAMLLAVMIEEAHTPPEQAAELLLRITAQCDKAATDLRHVPGGSA